MRKPQIFFDGVFLSIYSNLVKKLELFRLRRKKGMGPKDPGNGLFKKGQPIKKKTYFYFFFKFDIKAKWRIKICTLFQMK